jgi:predicted alpha/beta superfamily hydrolase
VTVLASTLVSPGPLWGQEPDTQPLTLGHATSVYSRVLGEDRAILVDLPTGYELTQSRYPVLYLLDGLAHFHHAAASVDFLSRTGRIPQMIVVGITNTARTRDMTPTHVEDRETSGGADTFIQFVEDELIPFVDDRYRTQPYRVLFGHSLGGMLAVYTMFTKPDLFAGYIAASPHLQYDDGYVVGKVEEILAGRPTLRTSIYLTLGDEPDYAETLERFTGLLAGADDSGLRWEYQVLEQDDHMSTPLKSAYEGLEMVFASWRYPGDLSEAEVSSVQAHYEKLSAELGYQVLIPEGLLNQLGYMLLARERYDDAVAAFKLNIDNYPGSANVYDSLGEAYEAMNEWSLAKTNYERAYKRGLEIDDRNTRIYKQHLDDLLEKLSEFD